MCFGGISTRLKKSDRGCDQAVGFIPADDFAADAFSPIYNKAAAVHQFLRQPGEQGQRADGATGFHH
jgi:hypothetical protein